ncbi:hypothetical protein [Luteococcus japonicus]|uniref:hypothetical protein n=1 Tax=Luteococcus japonicus TaxID=33984 RepID=UPI000B9AF023|nr:hypothetical protein [Luteococcus japonicus]
MNVKAVIGLLHANGNTEIPPLLKLGDAIGIQSPYGLRNSRAAEEYLANDEARRRGIVGIAFASSETGGLVEQAGDPVPASLLWDVEAEFFRRNGDGMELGSSVQIAERERPLREQSNGTIPAVSYAERELRQRENALMSRYRDFTGLPIVVRTVSHKGGVRLTVDGLVESTQTLIEAKSEAGRPFVLHAIGQLLDYGRLTPDYPNHMLLLPERPVEDLVELANSLGIRVCYETSDGFVTE